MLDEIGNRISTDVFIEVFANHAHWCGAAACQAFHKFDAVISIGADPDRIVRSIAGSRALDTKIRAQMFHQLEASGHSATECAADADVGFARRLLSKHRVEGDQLENIDWLQAELFRDSCHGLVADEPEVFLPQMQQRHGRASPVIARITRDRFIHFPLQLGGNPYARRVCHLEE